MILISAAVLTCFAACVGTHFMLRLIRAYHTRKAVLAPPPVNSALCDKMQ